MRKTVERGLLAALQPIIDILVRRRVHPNVLSTIGFLITITSAFAFHSHHVRTAGILILLGGSFDLLDGRVARATGLASKFGAFYDSTLDRMSEVAVYLGILSLYNDYRLELGDVGMIYAIMLAMAGSLMISYTRARAEGLGIDCKVGLMQRGERVILIGLASLLFGEDNNGLALRVVIYALAVLANLTAVHRIIWVYRHTRPSGNGIGPVETKEAATDRVGAEKSTTSTT
ncbi:MAG: CDP-alcohol phosphatidyltransferase family protein [Gemmatimonadetes bacterium]|uniref:CDP-alcohol phosphatidyltransferase family protein n=1 Tax=Candidatus Kutchimonas denitrificans TaxID=3056748 RepID=A0AAE4Z542_9BACT|nr:CDP-alcohol phosphatidyltransferase family protein [Gemmatimonadota bacterium]NIR73940.1 CDP-alcohol phosphatidyltransferase family protein [Candidatus Kutchimonas denitrificans]NIR99746.1 CDP-alcohol phosphatidyltransferase family protein [Gemmatimonadota bacterium]NIT65331.1 CDP-alcohol phosphatidyltransferase family protein [Gemmatimonadota bacterium]NIW73780.1 CDP-alcohol phosphatidyltransferase family protein [Gemmatimonadota bacterium]